MYNTQEIANRIKSRLKSNKTNAKEMLSNLDMGINAISEFAKGKQMSCISLAKIADYLDCSVDYLLGRSDTIQLNLPNDVHFVALIKYYESLNKTGRSEAEKRLEELTQIPKYVEPERQEEFNIG